MSEFKTVAKAGAVPEGEGRTFTVDGRVVGVFLIDGEYFAINDLSVWCFKETIIVSTCVAR
mgnify:CR=1 FL=1